MISTPQASLQPQGAALIFRTYRSYTTFMGWNTEHWIPVLKIFPVGFCFKELVDGFCTHSMTIAIVWRVGWETKEYLEQEAMSLPGPSPSDISRGFFLKFLFLSKYLFPICILHWTCTQIWKPVCPSRFHYNLFKNFFCIVNPSTTCAWNSL